MKKLDIYNKFVGSVTSDKNYAIVTAYLCFGVAAFTTILGVGILTISKGEIK